MTDAQVANKWVEETGAKEVFRSEAEAKKVGLSLLRAWRRYKKTGRCPWTGDELYDYTCFIHAFADKFAPEDDNLYHWLTANSHRLMHNNLASSPISGCGFCPVCGRALTSDNVARGENSEILSFAQGKSWCSLCAAEARLRKIIHGSA